MGYQSKSRRYLNYGKKPYVNPFFREKKKGSYRLYGGRFSLRTKLIFAGSILTAAGIIWLILFSGILQVREIHVAIAGQTETDAPEELRLKPEKIASFLESELSAYRWLVVPENNVLLVDPERLEKLIASRFAADHITVKKSYRGLSVSLADKRYAFIWEENHSRYYIGMDGSIIAPAGAEADSYGYPLIASRDDIPPRDGYVGFADQLPKISKLYAGLKYELPELAIDRMIIESEYAGLRIELAAGPDLLFAPDENDEDYSKQIIKLKTMIRDKLKDSYKNYNYIDVRFGDRVFYQ